jgi:hypothetical protein
LFIKRTKRSLRGKTYTNHLLVESVATERGPRHRVICSLGSLAPAPKAHWLKLAHHLEQSLGGQESLLEHSAEEQALVQKAAMAAKGAKKRNARSDINLDQVEVEEARQAGAVHVGHQIWQRLELDQILAGVGFSHKTRLLTQLMTLNRLIEPSSELAMSEWVARSALGDIFKENFTKLNEDRLYRNMDRLYGKRGPIEAALCAKEKTLFSLKESILLYDLTSTYFEGLCLSNPKAKRGYSRDSRPDCKQVVVGLVLDAEGFPKAHEIFAGNRSDSTTVADMLAVLQKRVAKLKMRPWWSTAVWPSPRTWQPSKRPAITGWWPLLSRSGSAILTNMKSRLAGRRSCERLPRAMKASTKCVCWLSRHKVLMAPRALPCAGAKAVRKKTALSAKSRKSAFWPTLKSWASVSRWADCGPLPRFTKPSAA